MSIHCKVLICVGVLAVAGTIAVVLWQTLGARSTARETDSTKNHTGNEKSTENNLFNVTSPHPGTEIPSDYLWPLTENGFETKSVLVIQEESTSTYSDPSYEYTTEYTSDIAGQESESYSTYSSIEITSEKDSDIECKGNTRKGIFWILNHIDESVLSTIPECVRIAKQLVSFPISTSFEILAPSEYYEAPSILHKIKNETLDVLNLARNGMRRIHAHQLVLFSQIHEVLQLSCKPEDDTETRINELIDRIVYFSTFYLDRSQEIATLFQNVLDLVIDVQEAFIGAETIEPDLLPDEKEKISKHLGNTECEKLAENIVENLRILMETTRTANETKINQTEVTGQLKQLESCNRTLASQTHELELSKSHFTPAERVTIINFQKIRLVISVLKLMQGKENLADFEEILSDFIFDFQYWHDQRLALDKDLSVFKKVSKMLDEFQVHWSNQTDFFVNLYNLIRDDLVEKVQEFVSEKFDMNPPHDSPQKIDMMHNKILDATEAIYQLAEVTNLYVNISDVYIAPCSQEIINFNETCRLSSQDILRFVGEMKMELLSELQMGRSAIDQYNFLYDRLYENTHFEFNSDVYP